MKFLLAIFGFFFLVSTIGICAFMWKVRKRMMDLRDAMQDNMNDDSFRRMADKYYYKNKRDEGPVFDEDYFKGDPDGKRAKARAEQAGQKAKQNTRRTTRTASGVTIFDDRDPNVAERKIFTHDEGEYVEFKEE